jgi:phosphate transport system permease protein
MSTTTEIESNRALHERVARRRRNQRREQVLVSILLVGAALISVLTTIGIVIILVAQSIGFFAEVSVWEFLLGTEWAPLFSPQKFGVLSLVGGTLLVAVIAGIVSLTLGLGAAIFLSEYAPERLRRVLKPILEVLAGIPTVVYGYFALTFVTPILQGIFGHDQVIVFNALSAGLVMGLMIMPMVSTLSEDAMVAVPRSLRDAAYALGATRFEVSTKVVIPAALSGIVASFILGVSRAIGETMTAYIVQVSLGETPQGSLEYKTIFAVGLLLFAMTLGMNIVGRWVISRFRQQYE